MCHVSPESLCSLWSLWHQAPLRWCSWETPFFFSKLLHIPRWRTLTARLFHTVSCASINPNALALQTSNCGTCAKKGPRFSRASIRAKRIHTTENSDFSTREHNWAQAVRCLPLGSTPNRIQTLTPLPLPADIVTSPVIDIHERPPGCTGPGWSGGSGPLLHLPWKFPT